MLRQVASDQAKGAIKSVTELRYTRSSMLDEALKIDRLQHVAGVASTSPICIGLTSLPLKEMNMTRRLGLYKD